MVAAASVALAGGAAAQTFPAAGAWVPFRCGAGPMVDAAGDTPNAAGALDLVGSDAAPAAFHAADAQFLYLRLRLAGSPVAGAALGTGAWGFELDLDGDRRSYELLLGASGNAVAIYRHPSAATLDDPADPSVTPPAFSYAFATHGTSSSAGTGLGGGKDAFVDFALPWSDLATVGVARDTPVAVWAGSSTAPNALDLDLACFGGAGARLSGIDVGATTPDPNAGGGGGAGGSGGRVLEGGLGCGVAARAPSPSSLVWLALIFAAPGARRYFRSSR